MRSKADVDPSARLFIGLWPDETVRAALLAHQQHWVWPARAALVPLDRLHLTLHFLGAVPREQVSPLAEGLVVPFERFDLQLDQAERWAGGVAVLQPLVPPLPLASLFERLSAALQRQGRVPERNTLRPHVTLARHAQGALPPPEVMPIHWHITGYALLESERGPPRRYRVIRHYR
ncbi:MAG TPA: RNA 2',3'-cyclic phosphodiesterase [Albitalea sp.]|nr:RNA 2',3'-cyclic phosphodiesterase [Albitalea sp.]